MTGDAYVPPMLPMLDSLPGVVGVGWRVSERGRGKSVRGLWKLYSSGVVFLHAGISARQEEKHQPRLLQP